ncbi:MAG: hypothetical protein QME12_04895 [Nanoarchaeota archaeon]|nr:hypothetical protein [Nanoarchaeota archaeon]
MLKEIEFLKIGLMAKGMQVSESARKAIEGDEKRPLTLADYASTSGISMQLENDIWVNAPIVDYNPNFVSETPYLLDFNGEFFVRSGSFEAKAIPVQPVPERISRCFMTSGTCRCPSSQKAAHRALVSCA